MTTLACLALGAGQDMKGMLKQKGYSEVRGAGGTVIILEFRHSALHFACIILCMDNR